jgi:hypothetical protein
MKMGKNKPTHEPGEYMSIKWDGSGQPECEAVWGHVSPEEFWATIQAEKYAYRYNTTEEMKATFGEPRHTYIRCVRAEIDHLCDYDYRYQFDCKPGRGAAKVTVADRRDS